MREEQKAYILEELTAVGVSVDKAKAEQLLSYYELLVERNRVMNLTRITDFADAVQKHFADSLSIVRILDLNSVNSVLDVGTGGGFPGVPLKICFPHLTVTLLDSVRKKTSFVNDVIRELGLTGACALHSRAEDLAADGNYRGRFDVCVSRAVANLSTLSEYCMPFVKKNGVFIAYKSGESEDEIAAAANAIQTLGGTRTDVFNYELNGMGRTLIKVFKGINTPSAYPRKAGMPRKAPL